MCVYVCVCVCVCVVCNTHTHKHTHAYTYTYMHEYIHTYTYNHTHTHTGPPLSRQPSSTKLWKKKKKKKKTSPPWPTTWLATCRTPPPPPFTGGLPPHTVTPTPCSTRPLQVSSSPAASQSLLVGRLGRRIPLKSRPTARMASARPFARSACVRLRRVCREALIQALRLWGTNSQKSVP